MPIYRLSGEQYQAMAQAGILTEDDPIERLEGWLAQKMTKKPSYTLPTSLTRRGLEHLLPTGGFVHSQKPITLPDSEPEPDAMVVWGDPRDYLERHPGPGEVARAVEVAQQLLSTDRGGNKRIYACAGLPVYWIVNLIERPIEVYTDPTGPAQAPDYRHHRNYSPDESIPVVLDGKEVSWLAVAELLP